MANTKKPITPKYIRALGRRKTATCVIKLVKGKQSDQPITINGKPISEYWPSQTEQVIWQEVFRTTNTGNLYTAAAIINGSGKQAQLGAFVHALARALDKAEPEKFHSILKKRGLLTRDSRAKERRKPGHAQKARAKKQSPKR